MGHPLLAKYRARFDGTTWGEPLTFEEGKELYDGLAKLDERIARIARISDLFQAQLQGVKAQLEHASRTDCLTGLATRRDMYEKLAAELSRSQRHDKTFALIMVDFDNFKQINDTHGHEMGDCMLVAAARMMQANLRKEDSCARWGGEEFLALLPETDRQSALSTAEKLRGAIAGLALDAGGAGVRMTASFGIALYRRGETVSDCIRRADEALYQAKSAGRNRSVLHRAEA